MQKTCRHGGDVGGGWQGIRPARQSDLKALEELLGPLERAGITKHRPRKQLMADIPCFTVVERESKAPPLSSPALLCTTDERRVASPHSC